MAPDHSGRSVDQPIQQFSWSVIQPRKQPPVYLRQLSAPIFQRSAVSCSDCLNEDTPFIFPAQPKTGVRDVSISRTNGQQRVCSTSSDCHVLGWFRHECWRQTTQLRVHKRPGQSLCRQPRARAEISMGIVWCSVDPPPVPGLRFLKVETSQ